MIVGIILSAGESRRMGTEKQLLPWGNTTVLQQVVRNASASRLDRLELVLGHRADEIARQITPSSKTRIHVNRDFEGGMSTSIKCGIRNAPADAEAYMLLLGDQPFVETGMIDAVIAAYRAGQHGIVIPVHKRRRGHPVIFDSRYREELLAMGDEGARPVVRKHADDIHEVSVDSAAVLKDMDTPQDYQEALARLKQNND